MATIMPPAAVKLVQRRWKAAAMYSAIGREQDCTSWRDVVLLQHRASGGGGSMELPEVLRLFRKVGPRCRAHTSFTIARSLPPLPPQVLMIPPHSVADISIRKLFRLLDQDRSGEVNIDELFVFLVPPDCNATVATAPPLSPERRLRRSYQTSPSKARRGNKHFVIHDGGEGGGGEGRKEEDEVVVKRRLEMDQAMMRIDVKFDDIMRRAGQVITPRREHVSPTHVQSPEGGGMAGGAGEGGEGGGESPSRR